MLKLKISYFLNLKGEGYFPLWFEELRQKIDGQVGFVDIHYKKEEAFITVFLSFENQETLDLWASTDRHDEFVKKIEPYFLRPEEVVQIRPENT